MRNTPNLDFMRAFAVMLVVIDHLLLSHGIMYVGPWHSEWIGVVGVYMFFVHTCLVLMWSLERKPHTLDFYIRRAFRIYPLVWIAILFTLLFHAPVGGTPTNFYHYGSPRPAVILSNLALTHNLAARGTIIGVLWSLPLEVDMYILLPPLFFFVRKNFSLWPLLLLWVLAAALANLRLSDGNSFETVIPCFLPGVMAYVLFRRVTPRLPAWLFPVFLLSLTELFMLSPSVRNSWPMCLALGIGIPFFRQMNFSPAKRVSHEFAKYSYGIYLSHSFAIVLGFYVLHASPAWLQSIVFIASLAAFSIAGYHAVEKPMIDLGAKLARSAERRYEQRHAHEFAPK